MPNLFRQTKRSGQGIAPTSNNTIYTSPGYSRQVDTYPTQYTITYTTWNEHRQVLYAGEQIATSGESTYTTRNEHRQVLYTEEQIRHNCNFRRDHRQAHSRKNRMDPLKQYG